MANADDYFQSSCSPFPRPNGPLITVVPTAPIKCDLMSRHSLEHASVSVPNFSKTVASSQPRPFTSIGKNFYDRSTPSIQSMGQSSPRLATSTEKNLANHCSELNVTPQFDCELAPSIDQPPFDRRVGATEQFSVVRITPALELHEILQAPPIVDQWDLSSQSTNGSQLIDPNEDANKQCATDDPPSDQSPSSPTAHSTNMMVNPDSSTAQFSSTIDQHGRVKLTPPAYQSAIGSFSYGSQSTRGIFLTDQSTNVAIIALGSLSDQSSLAETGSGRGLSAKSAGAVSSMSSGVDICRICHCEWAPDAPLIAPCHCCGSLKFVHQKCLQQWIKSSQTKTCEVCRFAFIMQTKLKPFRKWEKLDISAIEKRKIFCSVAFHIVAITCVMWSLYVLIDRTIEEIRENSLDWPFWTKLIVVAVGFTGGLVFMYVQCKMYVQLFARWRSFNRVIYVGNGPGQVEGSATGSPTKAGDCDKNGTKQGESKNSRKRDTVFQIIKA